MSNLDTEAREAIRQGAEYISENGHNRETMFAQETGAYHTYEWLAEQGTPACALGSVLASTGGMDQVFDHARELLWHSIQDAYGSGAYVGVGGWNDNPATSAEDVILLMKRVGNEVE